MESYRRRKMIVFVLILSIIMLCSGLVHNIKFNHENEAVAYSSANLPSSIGQIYDAQYGVFDKLKLDSLAIKAGFDNFEDMVAKASGSSGTTKTAADFGTTTIDFGTFGNNTSKDLTWIPVYLSQTSAGEPILTLWLASCESQNTSSNQEISTFTDGTQSTAATTPRSSVYSKSYVRSVVLNNGGDWYSFTTSASTRHTYTAKSDGTNKFEQLTTGNLAKYISMPSQVDWQINAAYQKNDLAFTKDAAYSGANADGWKNDKLWLPSFYEIYDKTLTPNTTATAYGGDLKDNGGLWATSNNLRITNATVMIRSAFYGTNHEVGCVFADGSVNEIPVKNSFGVRPALHLNLSEVAKVTKLPMPSFMKTTDNKDDNLKYYDNGNDVVFELDKIGSDYVDINVTATDMEGNALSSPSYSVNNSVLSFNANQVGKYVVTVKPKDGECWADGTNSEKSYTYYLKYHVTPLLFASDTSNLVYKGSKHYIEVENYDEDFMTVTPSTGAAFEKIPSGDNAGNWAISATNAGDNYRVTVSLKNTEFMEWTDNDQSGPKTLTFNISKKTLNVTASSLWSTEVYTGKEYELTLDCADEDIGKLRFEGYYTGGGITEETRVDVQPVMSATEKKVTIRLPRLSDKGTYSYILKLAEGIAANGNYTLSFNYDFEVGNKKIDLSSSDIVWRYANSNIDGGTF
ncbi:MAG: hypothetical protein K2H36_03745, partial [Clostridia bacterium]|nr:hypothetical protein [Clostridia bacterium]